MKKKIIGIIICMLLITIAILPATGLVNIEKNEKNIAPSGAVDWWYMFQHDPQLSGFSTSTAPSTNDVKWTSILGVPFGGFCSPAVVDDKLYIGSSMFGFNKEQALGILENVREKRSLLEYRSGNYFDSSNVIKNYLNQDTGFFYCLDAENGFVIWDFYTEGFVISSPAVSNGKVFLSSVVEGEWTGQLYCLDAEDGYLIWDYSICTSIYSSPIVVDGKVYLGSIEDNGGVFVGKMTCFNANNGNIIWDVTIGEGEYLYFSVPAVAYGNIYFITTVEEAFGNIYCLDADTGTQKWKTFAVPTLTSPAIADGYVYFSSVNVAGDRGILVCLDAESGQEKWCYTMGYNIVSGYSSPAVGYGKVFIATIIGLMDGCKLLCINAENGNYIWGTTTSDWMMISSPAVADEKLYIASWLETSKLYCFNVNNGNIIWNYPISMQTMSSPAVANKGLYMADTFGFVYCFGDTNSPPNKPDIDGRTSGKPGTSYAYTFTSIDPDDDQVSYYIDWDDGDITDWTAFQPSGDSYSESHTWATKGTYTIRAKAKDTEGHESDWGTLTVTMPRNKATINSWFLWFFKQFPLLERFLTLLVK
ncbi:MAG: PQQ-binding-like beta-propeller repeat protein [Thermoplasmatales archaeon]|nr:PQQ-binding-like beta-propeller repeat protein [Thermoplasmatales archaeon]